jgi:hypothetical protein
MVTPTSLNLLTRTEASNDGCQLDIIFVTELVADVQVRAPPGTV